MPITQWIPANPEEPAEEHLMPADFFFENSRETVKEYLGGEFEFIQVLHEDQPMYMLVHEMGAILPLPINPRATEIYHQASRATGMDWPIDSPPFIHGPAILVKEQLK